MNGKSKCKILKEIRKQIARENDIEFITSECKYKGDCLGTCPRCEAEVRYLEAELLKRRRQGKNIAVAGLAAALVATSVGCSGDKVHNESSSFSDLSAGGSTLTPTDNSLIEEITGEMVELQGDIAPEYIVDPTSRPEKAEPDSEHFLSLKKSEQLDYIAGFSREELQTAWEDNFSSISNKTHDYYLFFGAVTKRLDVEYGANDKVISVEIIKNYNSHTSYTSSANSSGSNPTKDSSERYTTMGVPRVNTQSSASDTESELEYHATPNLEYFLHLYDGVGFNNSFETWNKPNHYLSHYTRKQIKKAWKDCFVTTVNGIADIYDVFGTDEKLLIRYDKTNKFESFGVTKYKTSSDSSGSAASSSVSSVESRKPVSSVISNIDSNSEIPSTIVSGSEISSNENSIASETVSDTSATPSDIL